MTPEQQKQVESLIPYIRRVVRTRASDDAEYEEFFAAACLAVCKAIPRWSPEGGASVKTFIYPHILNACRGQWRFDQLPVSVPYNADISSLSRSDAPGYVNTFVLRNGSRKLSNLLKRERSVKSGNFEGVDEKPTPAQQYRITEFFESFSPRVKDMLEKYFIDGLSMREIANITNISHQRVQQIIAAAKKQWRMKHGKKR